MNNSPYRRTISPQKVPEDKDNPQPTLSDLEKTIKEAKDRLGQKKREFDFIAKLDKKQVSKYVLGADHEVLAHTLKKDTIGSPERIPSPVKFPLESEPKRTNWMTLPDRKANIQELNKYMEKVKDDFYEPISKERVKELNAQLKKERDKFSLANIREDDAKVAEKYHSNYSNLLRDQLRQEAERRRRNKYLIEMHEMRMILAQKVNINDPKIWKKESLDAGEAKRVREAFDEKLRSYEDKSLQYSINYETDITKKIEAYLNSKYKDVNVEKEIAEIIKERKNLPQKSTVQKENLSQRSTIQKA